MENRQLTLQQFAARRAVMVGIVAGLLNVIIVYVTLSGLPEVPIFVLEADIWKHSLVGVLIPRAIMISLLITFTTVGVTVRNRVSGDVHPPIERDVKWVGGTLKLCLLRAIYGFVLVEVIALVLRLLFPAWATISVRFTICLVSVFAAVIAYLTAYTAVLRSARIIGENDRAI